MYSKEQVISIIGYDNWEAFEDYMMGDAELDDDGLETYHPQDVDDFLDYCGIDR